MVWVVRHNDRLSCYQGAATNQKIDWLGAVLRRRYLDSLCDNARRKKSAVAAFAVYLFRTKRVSSKFQKITRERYGGGG